MGRARGARRRDVPSAASWGEWSSSCGSRSATSGAVVQWFAVRPPPRGQWSCGSHTGVFVRARIGFQPALLPESYTVRIPNDLLGHCLYADVRTFKHTGVCPISSKKVSILALL